MANKKINHIAIAGNIGAGKSTLTNLLAKNFNWTAQFEDVENNPYLNDFYDDMPRWSFNLQIYFLNSRYQQVIEIKNNSDTVIQDRTIYEDAEIFAPNLHRSSGPLLTAFVNVRRVNAAMHWSTSCRAIVASVCSLPDICCF